MNLKSRVPSIFILKGVVKFYFAGVLFLSAITGYSQSVRFINYFTDQGYSGIGLPHLIQDSLGYLWIKAGNAIYRFDGYEFKVYKNNSRDSLMLPESGGLLHIAPGGNLIVHDDDLLFFDRNLDGFIKHEPDVYEQPVLTGGSKITSLYFESNDLVWFGSYRKGLGLFNLRTLQTETYLNNQDHVLPWLPSNYINQIVDCKAYFLLATRHGLWKFNKETKIYSKPECQASDSTLLYSYIIQKVFSFDDHYWLWVNSQNEEALVKLDKGFNINRKFSIDALLEKFDKTQSYSYPDIHNIVCDDNETFWLASRGLGLIRYNSKTDQLDNFRHDPKDQYSIASDQIVDVMIDRDQNVWTASFNGAISKLKKPSLDFFNYLESEISGGGVEMIHGENQDNLLVTTQGNGIWLSHSSAARLDDFNFLKFVPKTKTSGFDNIVRSHVGKDYVWFGSFTDGVIGYPIDKKNGTIRPGDPVIFQKGPNHPRKNYSNFLTSDEIVSLYEDRQNTLWVGTSRNWGINRVNLSLKYGTDGSVKQYLHNEQDSNSLAFSPYIMTIFPEDDSSLWVVTTRGLDLYRNERFIHVIKGIETLSFSKAKDGTLLIGSKSGLYVGNKSPQGYSFSKLDAIGEDVTNSFTEDNLGRWWIGTNTGLVFYNPKNKTVLRFNEQDGLASSQLQVKSLPNGIIAATTRKGISFFDPLTLKLDKANTRPVLTQLRVNNKTSKEAEASDVDDFKIPNDINGLDQLVLDHKHNIFTIEFAALELTDPNKNLYEYKLEGFNENWIRTDAKNRRATYTNLDPGNYTFRVKATNANGIWSDKESTLKIAMLPPPWRTWWAYTGYGLMFAGLLYWARKNIVNQERLSARLKLEQVEREKEHFELEKAKEVDKVKTSFFTNISHEFRTPLTLIKGPVHDLLEKYTSDPKTQQKLKLVQRNSDLLLKLINQLLDLAKLESGTLKVEKSEGDLLSFVRAIASSFTSFAAQKNITVHVDVPGERYRANFDKDKLETILINLINNAIKFTPANGTVTVTAVLHLDTNVLILQVKDTGIGISEEHQTKIFERFHQVSEAHKEVGTGIGLALVKELVALMEGTISVKSEVGKGSEFLVELPIEVIQFVENEMTEEVVPSHQIPVNGSRQLAIDGNPLQKGDETKPHILVVEDNTDLRHFIIDSLGEEFYFHEAENGKIGLNIATSEIPDMIVSDVMMPEMDGITMAAKIKNDIRTSHIQLILLTAKSTEDSKLSGLQSGADDYLTKPFNKQELLLKVRNGVSRQLKLREKLRADLMSTAPKVEVLSADEQFLNDVKEGILKRLSDEQLSVESLAEDMGMSRVQLYRKVTGLTGMSVNELIRKLRLQRAAQLLQQKWGPVSQVAYEVGFSNLSYFSKMFKEEFGVLPSEYMARV